MKRIIVCGGRDYSDRAAVEHALSFEPVCHGWDEEPITIVHGDARGADRLAAEVARNFEYAVEAHPADWGLHGKAAGPIRNEAMAKCGADLCIAFPGRRGTEDMVRRARAHGIPVKKIS